MRLENKNWVSRRDALIGAGKIAAGAAMGSITAASIMATAEVTRAKFPWGYKKIDPRVAANIAYENWYKGFCCYAVASGILAPLQKSIGEPYASFPIIAVKWGHGGAVGWGSLCGSLTGAGFATGLIAGHEGEKILNDVITWYTETDLPIYKPLKPRALVKNINTSDSPLCHVSVGKWMKKEGVAFNSPPRRDRCARLSADVAMRTVALLNDWVDGKFKSSHGNTIKENGIPTQRNCTECHGDDVPVPITT